MGYDVEWDGFVKIVPSLPGNMEELIVAVQEVCEDTNYYLEAKWVEYEGTGLNFVQVRVQDAEKCYPDYVEKSVRAIVDRFHSPQYVVDGILIWEDDYHEKGYISIVNTDVLVQNIDDDWKRNAVLRHEERTKQAKRDNDPVKRRKNINVKRLKIRKSKQ